jgi:adenosine deaminase
VTGGVIIGIQRQFSEEDALATIEACLPYRENLLGLGLGGPEIGNPPGKFRRAFERARELGWHIVAHAGEEGDAAYVREALDELDVDRIDLGVRCEDAPPWCAGWLTRALRLPYALYRMSA